MINLPARPPFTLSPFAGKTGSSVGEGSSARIVRGNNNTVQKIVTNPDEVKDFAHLYNKLNPVLCDRYMHACDIAGHPAICAYMAGNYMSYINDWRPMGCCSDEEMSAIKSKRHKVTSLLCESVGYKFVAVVTTDSIWENDEIFTDYGENYWAREAYIREGILALKDDKIG